MRRIAMVIASAGIIAGSLTGTPTAGAAAVDTTITPPAQPTSQVPIITALDCVGTTGVMGCGPGWVWRNGWQGFRCYIC